MHAYPHRVLLLVRKRQRNRSPCENSLVALGNAASSHASGQRSREMPALPALPAITSEASGSESTPSIPKWNRRARGVHRFVRLKTPLGTPKRVRLPSEPH